MKATKLGVMTFSAMLVVSACGGGTPAASGGAAGAPAACNNKVGTSSTEIHVYSSLPRQGTNTEQTNTLVEQEKKILDGVKVGKWTIKYFDLDDSSAANNGDWDGTVEQANANKAVNDPDAMAYIGTYNSGAAKLAIPILNQNCLVMVTPANTYPGLTKAVNGVTKPGEPDTYYPGGYRNYSRVVGTDDAQGAAGAEWAKSLGGTKAYVLDDTQVYGQGLAKSFALAFTNGGGTILSANGTSEGFDPKASDYNALAQKIKSSGADFIYIGSITGNNTGKLWKDLRSAMPDIKIMSGDGVYEKSWYGGVGSAGNGTYLTFGAIGAVQDRSRWHLSGRLHGLRQRRRDGRPRGPEQGRHERPLPGPQERHGHQWPGDGHRHRDARQERRRHGWRDHRLPGGDQLAAEVRPALPVQGPVAIRLRPIA